MNKINELLENYINNNPNRLLNLRADYRTINDSNLKSRDYIFNQLIDEYEYMGSTGCLSCYTSYFNTPSGDQICYHRGIENSAVVTKDKIYVNDVIIDMYGNLFYDWNKPLEHINEFRSLFSLEEFIAIDGDSVSRESIVIDRDSALHEILNAKTDTPGDIWARTRCGGAPLLNRGYSDDVNGAICGAYRRNSYKGSTVGHVRNSGRSYHSGCGGSSSCGGGSYHSGCGCTHYSGCGHVSSGC